MNASTTVTILRTGDEVLDQYGDPVDNDTAVSSGNPASIVERDLRSVDRVSGEGQLVRYVVGRVYPGVDVKRGDRVRDERTGETYTVDSVTRPKSGALTPDTRLELRKTSG